VLASALDRLHLFFGVVGAGSGRNVGESIELLCCEFYGVCGAVLVDSRCALCAGDWGDVVALGKYPGEGCPGWGGADFRGDCFDVVDGAQVDVEVLADEAGIVDPCRGDADTRRTIRHFDGRMKRMQTTTLGNGGPEVGVIGLGCMGMTASYDLETARDDATSIAVIHRAIDLGITLIDTADAYGPYTNEELVGRALSGAYRERAVLATKVGLVMGASDDTKAAGPASPGAGRDGRPEHVRESIDGSLRRLGTEYVDLYQLHRVDPGVPLEETWGAMAETVGAGKARRIGLSEVSVDEIKLAQRVHPVATVQSELSLWTRDVLPEVLPYCAQQGIGLLPFAPLGRGFLAGRFASFDDLPQDDFRRKLPRFQQEALRANLEIVARVRKVAERLGVTPAQVALAWVIAQGPQVVPIPGTKTPKYLEDNAGAAAVTLSTADLAELDEIPAPTGSRY
jgi:aryl-alcohol dehydrogenase-like predicted oxidoreductase